MRGTAVRAWAVSAGLVAVLAASAGCNIVFDVLSDGTVAPDPITEIHMTGGSGDVTIEPESTVHTADIRRTVRYSGSKPGATFHIDGTVLTIDTSCAGNCSVSYVVRIPPRAAGAGLVVTGDNGSGDVRITGVGSVDVGLGSGDLQITDVAGPVTTKTGSGDTRISGVTGNLSVTTSSGGVDGKDLTGGQVTVVVSSGDIRLDLAGTGNATVRTSSGDITVTVPDHTASVSVDTDSGDRNVNVTPDPASPYHLDLHTGSGDVNVNPR